MPVPPPDQDAIDVDKAPSPTLREAISKRQGGAQKKHRPRQGLDEHLDNSECLALLMQLALMVCNADILDCVAVMSSFLSADRAALLSVASKVLTELSKCRSLRRHADGARREAGGSEPTTPRFVVAGLTSDNLVSSFLQKVPDGGKCAAGLPRGPSLEFFPGRSSADDVAHEERSAAPRLNYATTSRTEISVSSFSAFRKDRRSFTLRSDIDLDKVLPNEDQSLIRDIDSFSGGNAEVMKPRLMVKNNSSRMTGSLAESLSSGSSKVSRLTQASARIRSMLLRRADKSKLEKIGDMTWAMDGIPHYEGCSQDTKQTEALLQRYGGSYGAESTLPDSPASSGSTTSTVGIAECFALNSGSLLMHVYGKARRVISIDCSAEDAHPTVHRSQEQKLTKESLSQETEATWMLLDKVLQSEDFGGSSAFLTRMRTSGSCEGQVASNQPLFIPVKATTTKRDLSDDSGLSSVIRDAIAVVGANNATGACQQHLPGMAQYGSEGSPVARTSSISTAPTLQTSAQPVPKQVLPADGSHSIPAELGKPVVQPTVESCTPQEEAMAKWQERRAKKRASGMSKMTYGQIIRGTHEQMLPVSDFTNLAHEGCEHCSISA